MVASRLALRANNAAPLGLQDMSTAHCGSLQCHMPTGFVTGFSQVNLNTLHALLERVAYCPRTYYNTVLWDVSPAYRIADTVQRLCIEHERRGIFDCATRRQSISRALGHAIRRFKDWTSSNCTAVRAVSSYVSSQNEDIPMPSDGAPLHCDAFG